jgi:hypothetical protein
MPATIGPKTKRADQIANMEILLVWATERRTIDTGGYQIALTLPARINTTRFCQTRLLDGNCSPFGQGQAADAQRANAVEIAP